MPSDKFRQLNPKNKQTKFRLLFDEESRREFLTGFQKRKKARRKLAQQEAEEKQKEGRRKERQKRREALEEELKTVRLPELNPKHSEKNAVLVDHPEHTVTITSDLDLKKEHGGIGDNEVEYEDEDDLEDIDNDEEEDRAFAEDEGSDDEDDVLKQRLRNDADGDYHGNCDDGVKDAKNKKKAIMNKRRQQMKQQAAKRKRGVSQATARKMKSMKRKSLGKFMKRGSNRKKPSGR